MIGLPKTKKSYFDKLILVLFISNTVKLIASAIQLACCVVLPYLLVKKNRTSPQTISISLLKTIIINFHYSTSKRCNLLCNSIISSFSNSTFSSRLKITSIPSKFISRS